MYEMYPDAWTEEQATRQQRNSADQPRRRSRKQHSVVPVALAQQIQSAKEPVAG